MADLEKLLADNRGLVFFWVRRYLPMIESRAAIDAEDLAQAGFLGMIEAVRTFDSDKGAWSTWASYYIRKAIIDALGVRKQRPEDGALSLDVPANPEDTQGGTLLDMIPDTSLPEIDAGLIRDEIIAAVRMAIESIQDNRQRRALELTHIEGATAREAAACLEMDEARIRDMNRTSFSQLRKNRKMRALADLDSLTRFHAHKGLAAFVRDETSVVEEAVFWRDEQRGHAKCTDTRISK